MGYVIGVVAIIAMMVVSINGGKMQDDRREEEIIYVQMRRIYREVADAMVYAGAEREVAVATAKVWEIESRGRWKGEIEEFLEWIRREKFENLADWAYEEWRNRIVSYWEDRG